MKCVVIYRPVMGYTETHGPFNDIIAAKSWMAQTLDSIVEKHKKDGHQDQTWWSDDKRGSCGIKDFGTWEISELLDI